MSHFSHNIWNLTSKSSGLFEYTSPTVNSFPKREVNTVFLKSVSLTKSRSFSLMFWFAWFANNRRIAAGKVEQLALMIYYLLSHPITWIYCQIPRNFSVSFSKYFPTVSVFLSWHKSIGPSIVGLWFLPLTFNEVFL